MSSKEEENSEIQQEEEEPKIEDEINEEEREKKSLKLEEDQAEEEEEDESYQAPKKKKSSKGNSKKKLAGNKRSREKNSKSKRMGVRQFLELDAQEGDDDEEESEGELGKLTENERKKITQKYNSNELSVKNKGIKIDDNNMDEFIDKYNNLEYNAEEDEEEDNYETRRPNLEDPKLWLVKCRAGEETECVANLFHKYFYYKDKEPKERLKIFSITKFDNLRGKIFMEAYCEKDIIKAINGLSNIFEKSVQVIPLNEMTQIFEFDKYKKVDIKNDQLVRIKHGNYEGDLARVLYIEDQVNRIHISLVPRIINDSTNEKEFKIATFSKQRSSVRPSQKNFDMNKYKVTSEKYPHINDVYGFGKYKFRNGLLIKVVNLNLLEIDNVCPKTDEIQKLGFTIENGQYVDKYDGSTLICSLKENNIFKKGDRVKLVGGQFQGTSGVVSSQEGEKVRVKLNIRGRMEEDFEFPVEFLEYIYYPGEMVNVISGVNKGRSGIIIKIIDKNKIMIYNELSEKNIIAHPKELILSSQVSTITEENSLFKIGEMVRISNNNVICYIIDVSKYSIKVVTNSNELKTLSIRDVERLHLNKKVTSIDSKRNPITKENRIKIINGPYKGAKGVIKNIYKHYIFIYDKEYVKTNGIFCEINNNVELLGSELLVENSEKGKVNLRKVPDEIKDYFGKTVHVIEGSYKGYNGIVVDVNDKFIKLELSAQQKIIQLPSNYVKLGDINSASKDDMGMNSTPSLTMKTPAYYPHGQSEPFL